MSRSETEPMRKNDDFEQCSGIQSLKLALIAFAAIQVVACAGVRVRMDASALEHPVSFSRSYIDASGAFLTPGPEEIVERFSFEWTSRALVAGLIPVSENHPDLARRLEAEIDSRSADAIVNLTIKASANPAASLLGLIPVIPAWISFVVEGDVVRFSPP